MVILLNWPIFGYIYTGRLLYICNYLVLSKSVAECEHYIYISLIISIIIYKIMYNFLITYDLKLTLSKYFSENLVCWFSSKWSHNNRLW